MHTNFRIIFALLLCLTRLAVGELPPEEQPEFPALGDYLKGGSDSSDDLTEFLNNHYIRLRLPRSKTPEIAKGSGKQLRKFAFPVLLLVKLKAVIVFSALILLALLGLSLTKSFAVVIHQDNYEYRPDWYHDSWHENSWARLHAA